MNQLLSLQDLRDGDLAVVEDFDCGCEETCRLASMGLCPGATVRMVMAGSPCAVQVGECRLMLRSREANAILVSPLLRTGSAA